MAKVNTRKRGKYWEYYFEAAKVEGKRSKISKGGYPTQKEAFIEGTKALEKYNSSGLNFVPSEISFNDYIDFWFKEYAEANLKPETLTNYRKRIKNHIKPAFSRYKLKSITPAVLQSFINEKFNQGYSRNTMKSIKGILSKAFQMAVEPFRFIGTNPMLYIKIPGPRAKPEVPTRTAPHVFIPKIWIDRIFERFPKGTSTYFPMSFAYKGGTRPGESFAFEWEDVNFELNQITVNRQVQWDDVEHLWYFTDPKYDSFRTIDLDQTFMDELKEEYENQQRARLAYGEHYTRLYVNENRELNKNGDGREVHLICVRQNGDFIVPRSMQHTSSVIHHELEYPEFDMHSLRVTHATMLIESGAPVKYVQQRLGHKKLEVTMQIYTKLSPLMIEQGKNILESVF
ncbi:MAG: site-specific integrase [Clostridia bacterium]|nr:site-specific integrase [Clostridia bacterium]